MARGDVARLSFAREQDSFSRIATQPSMAKLMPMNETKTLPGQGDARSRPLRQRTFTTVLTTFIAAGLAALLFSGGVATWVIFLATQPTLEAQTAQVSASATPAPKPRPTPTAQPTPTVHAQPTPEPMPAPVYDVDSPASITVVVNKQRTFTPVEWAPDDLVLPEGIPNVWGHPIRAEAASALQQMYAAASEAGVPFTITSGYRDYWLQKDIYDGLVAQGGVEFADSDTARPGHSEHQTGLTVDLFGNEGCRLSACFGETATGSWLRENAHRFGYILRYHDGEQATVGYTYEPWHFRYVGVDVATLMHDRGVRNLEDFFGLPAAPTN